MVVVFQNHFQFQAIVKKTKTDIMLGLYMIFHFSPLLQLFF